MKGTKIAALVLACMCVLGSIYVPASAAQVSATSDVIIMATERFSTSIPANKTVYVGDSFSLAAGEVVTIWATYSPIDASIDFGLIAPDGLFYGLGGKDGVFYKPIKASQSGLYRLAIRNSSSISVSVSGHVNY